MGRTTRRQALPRCGGAFLLVGLVALVAGCSGPPRLPVGTAFVLAGPVAADVVAASPGGEPEGGRPGAPAPGVAGPEADPGLAGAAARAAEASGGRAGTGRVVALVDGEARPVSAGWVASSDGRRVQADGAGWFRWEGEGPGDGLWLAGAPGHVTSVVAGLGPEPPALLHLEPLAVTRAAAVRLPTRSVALEGQVLDAAGRGRPGVVVVLGGAGLAGAPAATTDASGRYVLAAALPEAGVPAATVLAAGVLGGELGVLQGVTVGPASRSLPPLVVAPATLTLKVSAPAPPGLPPPRTTLTLRAVDGTRLGLVDAGEGFRLAEVAGLAFDLAIEARSPDGLAYSRVERPGVGLDWARAEVVWAEAMLPPAALDPPPVLALGGDLGWPAVAGAAGYTVRLAGPRHGDGWPWEAFTVAPGVRLLQPLGRLEPGAWTLEVMAWDAPGLAPRALAQVRRLRRVDRTGGLRVSGRRVELAL
ncbi:MAG: hypothetical protein VKQ33_03755 [Candidatus Sericytochromatia bacterium]|nr:hypothetical protein [Candidatus Sericytochromatia bacterium]